MNKVSDQKRMAKFGPGHKFHDLECFDLGCFSHIP